MAAAKRLPNMLKIRKLRKVDFGSGLVFADGPDFEDGHCRSAAALLYLD
ncbi:hypothetical protein [Mesorhizobium sp. ORS 3428]|nr:hypothetical protein [Mesorhizobium sp. ORS 3428]